MHEAEKSWLVNIFRFWNIYWAKWSSYLSLDRNKMNDTKYGYLFSVAKFSNSFEIICQSSRCAASFGNHLSPTTTSILATKDRKLYHFLHRGQGTYGKSVVCNNTRVSNICYQWMHENMVKVSCIVFYIPIFLILPYEIVIIRNVNNVVQCVSKWNGWN